MKYQIAIYETVRHDLEVEADTEDDALQEAYILLSNKTEAYLAENHGYDSDAEYSGYHEIYEEN
jgi:hypothetical protein